jgi:hypothetical protein
MKKVEIKIEIKRKTFFIFLAGVLMIISGFFLITTVNAALTCSVASTCADVTLLKMYATANSHAGLPASSAYTNLVCCADAAAGLSNNCSGTFALVGTLSGADNAHYEDWTKTNYSSANDFCLSVISGTISVSTSTDCGINATVFSMSGTSGTNAHVGTSTAYLTKVCATTTAPSLTLIVSTDVFPPLTPGTPIFATSTISVDTNNSTGWYVTLARDDPDTTMDLDTDATVNIVDQTDWIPGAATTTAGNAVRISSFINSGDVLAFRMMTASGTPSFISTAWWGATDAYIDSATTLWAGIASSTASNLKIGNSSVSSGGSPALNTVLYYLDVPNTQRTGAYSGNIIFTAVMN